MKTYQKIKLGDILDVKRGMSLSGDFYATEGDYIRLTLGNFNYPESGWKENKSKDNLYYNGKIRSEFLLKKGDIITPLTEQVRGLLGNTATIPVSDLYIQSGDIGLIIPDESKVNKRFSYYLVSSGIVKKQLDAGSQQTKIRHTSPDAIKSCIAYIPDLFTQDKIGKLLDYIDNKIENNNKINDNLSQQTKLLYDYWFTQFDFPDENNQPYRSFGGKMVWNEQLKKEIPIGWEVKTLSELLQKNSEPFDYESDQPTIDLSVMPSNSIALSQLNSSVSFSTNLYVMKRGDILFGSIRPYLHKAGIAPCDGVVAGTVHSYRAIKQYDYNFALITITNESIFNYAVNASSGTKMPVVSSDSLLSYKVAYNKDIAERFNDLPIMDIITKNVQEIQKLIKLRDFLLPLLMNGQATIID